MKNFRCLVLMINALLCVKIFSAEFRLGDEYIKPLRFPKFSLSSDYGLNRNFIGLEDQSLRIALENRFEVALSFEAGLYKYMNAGGIFSGSLSQIESKKEPIDFKFGLFAKPFLPIGNRVAIFGRITGGLAVAVTFDTPAINFYRAIDKAGAIQRVYQTQEYLGWPFGAYGSLSIGVEVFPFSRFGLALEAGIRASIFRNHRNVPFIRKRANDISGTPSAFHFVVYEWPLSIMLHAII